MVKRKTKDQHSIEGLAGKYLTFHLGEETYGIEIMKVQEIISMMDVTHLTNAPDFVRGMIDLRGEMIPVIELRKKFNLPTCDDDDKTCIIVIHLVVDGNRIKWGIIVDEVSEVLDIAADEIGFSSSFSSQTNTDFIMDVAKVSDKVVILLDINKLLSSFVAGVSLCSR